MSRNKTSVEEKYNAPFPTALRALMDERGETQENIAKAAGKTRQTISQYVNGISEPGYDVLVKIADYFDVSLDYLFNTVHFYRPPIIQNFRISTISCVLFFTCILTIHFFVKQFKCNFY